MLFPVVRNLVNFKKDREQAWLFLRHGMWRGIVPVWIEGLPEPVLLKQDFNSTLSFLLLGFWGVGEQANSINYETVVYLVLCGCVAVRLLFAGG